MEEEKSFSDLLKEQGLDLAEDVAKKLAEALFVYVEKKAIESENKYDDLLLAVLPKVKPLVLDLLDKIDGEVG